MLVRIPGVVHRLISDMQRQWCSHLGVDVYWRACLEEKGVEGVGRRDHCIECGDCVGMHAWWCLFFIVTFQEIFMPVLIQAISHYVIEVMGGVDEGASPKPVQRRWRTIRQPPHTTTKKRRLHREHEAKRVQP